MRQKSIAALDKSLMQEVLIPIKILLKCLDGRSDMMKP